MANHGSSLCNLCASIDIVPLIAKLRPYEIRTFIHQPSYYTLQSSSADGCRLCRLFLASLSREDPNSSEADERPPLLSRSSTGFTSNSGSGIVADIAGWHQDVDAKPDCPRFMVQVQAESTLDTDFAIEYTVTYERQTARGISNEIPKPRKLILSCETDAGLEIESRSIGDFPSFGLYSSWLHSCAYGSRHVRCDMVKVVPLPSRLIDVGSGSGTSVPKLVTTGGSEGHYLTLSHCWGQTRPLITTIANLAAHVRGIHFAKLPKMFQDALLVTKILGYQYIWIDSLCIVQDDPRDWENECSRMGDIFRLSICTIAAPAASGSEHSLLSRRTVSRVPPCKLPVQRSGRLDGQVTIGFPPPDLKERTSALSSRAWVLQEQLLSPRTLYFGSQGMYFQCNSHELLETHHKPLPPERITSWRTDGAGDLPKPLLGMAMRDVSYWYFIVRQYSFRRLTYGEDKLPALSGLATLISNHMNSSAEGALGEYLAGLWSGDLGRGLMWTSDPAFENGKPLHYVDELAPSWSWASQNQPVEWRVLREFKSEVECISRNVAPTTSHLFGRVNRGELQLRAPIRTATLQRRPGGKAVALCGLVDFREIAEVSLDATATRYLETKWPETEPTFTCRLLRLGYADSSLYGLRWYALLLVPGDVGTFHRLGISSSLVPGTAHPRSLTVEQSFVVFEKARKESVIVV